MFRIIRKHKFTVVKGFGDDYVYVDYFSYWNCNRRCFGNIRLATIFNSQSEALIACGDILETGNFVIVEDSSEEPSFRINSRPIERRVYIEQCISNVWITL